MKLHIITHNVDGCSLVCNAVAENVTDALEDSCKFLKPNIGEAYQQKMLSGEYISEVKIIKIHCIRK